VALKLTTARWFTPSGRTIQREAKSEEEQFEIAQASLDSAPDPASSDSAIRERPVFHTDGGRVVRGGGGIVPDLVVRPDTLTTGEREFGRALGSHVPAYRDAITSYALELKRTKAVTGETFRVTPDMRQEIYQRLRGKGVDVSPGVFEGARGLIEEQLGYEVARYVFGRQAEFRRRSLDDDQLQTAFGLLRKAQTPRELMGVAMSSAGPGTRSN
jgi:carboxyl-terminal processing protease